MTAAPERGNYETEAFLAWLTATCQRQDVPATVRDPEVITHVAALLGTVPADRPHRTRAPASYVNTESARAA